MTGDEKKRETIKEVEAATGFEPVYDGFANRCLGPLGYAAITGIVQSTLLNISV